MAYEPEEDHIEEEEGAEETPSKPAKKKSVKDTLPMAAEDWEMGLPGGGAPPPALPAALPPPSFQLAPAPTAAPAPAPLPPGLPGVMGAPVPQLARKPDWLPYLP